MIKVNQVNKFFNRKRGNQIHVINDTTLEFADTGLVVLLGASGSGKTTLLNVIGGLDKVNSGSFEFDGKEIKRYSSRIWDKLRNEEVGYIFQNYNLLPQLSVFDNIAFVLKMVGINDKEVIEKYVNYVLKATNMFPYRHKKGLQLSGGQMQRVAIARALVKNPKVIIADEPTGNLDSKNTSEIMNIIKAISKEKLVILVTHDKELANFYGDRIIEIKDGKVIKDDTNDESLVAQYGEDNNIYLKDLENVSFENELDSVNLYFDKESQKEEIDIKLIVKNNVLYLKLDTKYKNVQILDEKSTLEVKDEHYKPKSKFDSIQTDYDIKTIDIESEKTKKRKLFSIKNAFLMTIKHLSKSKVRMFFMLLSFLLSGILIAFSTSLIFAQVNPDLSAVVERPEKYVVINSKKKLNTALLKAYISDKGTVNPYTPVSLSYIVPDIIDPDQSGMVFSTSFLTKQLDITENINPSSLTRGRMPEANDEIIIAEHFIADLINNRNLMQSIVANGPNAYGYWQVSDFLNEEVILKIQTSATYSVETTVKIVGMTNRRNAGVFINKIATYDLYTFGNGIITDTGELDEMILTIYNDINYRGSEAGINYFVYTDNPNELIRHINQYDSLAVKKVMDYYRETVKFTVVEYVMTIVAFAFGLIAALGFYFIIRSSMISRIYEISVYRALGVRKFEIIKSFIIEILSITIISSLIGFILTNIGLYNFNQEMVNIYPIFSVDFWSVLTGIIVLFGINLFFGLWPLISLLAKTPAQIISKYDI